MATKTRLPAALADLPEKPVHGNYICSGHHRWSHAEDLSTAYRIWRRSLTPGSCYCPATSTAGILAGLAICDASDDFQISHVTGGVTASKGTVPFKGSDYD